jgi:hypothetical protein
MPDPVAATTPQQLLREINERLRDMKMSSYSPEALTVWLCQQASENESDGALQPRVGSFLKSLLQRRRFEFPVEVQMVESDGVEYTDGDTRYQKISLPQYTCLQIRIFNVPRGSVDSSGNNVKIVWSDIVVATALSK